MNSKKQIYSERLQLSSNLGSLPAEALSLIAVAFNGKLERFENVYMVEVKIENALENIKSGKDIIFHQNLSQNKNHAHHFNDPEWAVIHKDDKDWNMLDKKKLLNIAKEYVHKNVDN